MTIQRTANKVPPVGCASTPAAADPPDTVPASTRLASFIVVVVPFAAFIVAIAWLWGWGIGWSPLVLMMAMAVLTTLGVTVGFHRLFTHRSFQTTRPVQAVLAALGSMAAEGPVVKWAAVHRLHHQHSDDPSDPHSPHLHGEGLRGLVSGLWHAHVGWLFIPDPPGLTRYVPDLMSNRLVRVMSRLFGLWVVVGLLVPAAVVGLLTMSWVGALQGFIWGGLVRIFLVHHVTWSINSACHLWGTRPFRTRDQSRNNPVFGVLGLGEGWHNNHHAFPASARHGLRWWELDVSHLIIRVLAWTGLAWKVRVPAPEKIAAKRRRREAETDSGDDRAGHPDAATTRVMRADGTHSRRRRTTEARDDDISRTGKSPFTVIAIRGQRLEPGDEVGAGVRLLRPKTRQAGVVAGQGVTRPQSRDAAASAAMDRWADDGGTANLKTGRFTAPPAVAGRACDHR